MAELGVQAIFDLVETGTSPEVSEGLDFFNTGVALVTDDPQDGVESHRHRRGRRHLLGLTSAARPTRHEAAVSGCRARDIRSPGSNRTNARTNEIGAPRESHDRLADPVGESNPRGRAADVGARPGRGVPRPHHAAEPHPEHAAPVPGDQPGHRARALDHRVRPAERALPQPREPLAHHAAGRRGRHARRRADAHHPHRRHRPLGRRRHGAELDGHRADRRCTSASPPSRPAARPPRRARRRRPERRARDQAQAATLHRHARHAEHLHRARPCSIRAAPPCGAARCPPSSRGPVGHRPRRGQHHVGVAR